MADVKSLILAQPVEVQQNPMVLAAYEEAKVAAQWDGFHGVPEYDFVREAIDVASGDYRPMVHV